MTLPKRALAFACLALSLAAPLAAQPPAPSAAAVTVQLLSVVDQGQAPIPVAIWSPANGTSLPLVVISHGTGAALTSHIDTAQALAQAGFVVVAPMHPGDNYQDQGAVGRPEWLVNRARHVEKVIDFMLARWEGHARLAPSRIGIFGFSAGGTTALVSIGGVPDLGSVPAHCARQREFVCNLMQAGQAGGGAPPPWVHDRRIAAAVIAAPGLGFAFAPSGLANVRVPVQLWAGAADQTVPYETNAAVVQRLLTGPVDFHSVPGAGHLSFLAPCGPDSPPQICQDGPGFDRAAFHRDFNRSIVEFFRTHLTAGGPAR